MSSEINILIKNTQRPLIGLEYIAVLVNAENTSLERFRCLACRENVPVSSACHVLKHVESVEHQMTYLVSIIRFAHLSIRRQISIYFWVLLFFAPNRLFTFQRFRVNYLRHGHPSKSAQFLCTPFVMPSNEHTVASSHNF